MAGQFLCVLRLTGNFGRWLGFGCLVAGLAACQKHDAPAIEPRPALLAVVKPAATTVSWTLPGQVVAPEATLVSFRVGGKIISRSVASGDRVQAGDVLARLDAVQPKQSLESAQAQLQAAKQNLTFARQQYERDVKQSRANLIAPAQLEQSRNAYSQAQAAQAQAAQQASLASDQLAYTELTADYSGIITAEHAQTGQNVAAGQAVYTLAQDSGADVVVDIPERRIANVTLEQEAEIRINVLPDKVFHGRVREIAASADPASRTFRVKLAVHSLPQAVRLGMTATVRFVSDTSSANTAESGEQRFSVPATALFHQGDKPAVWLFDSADSTLRLQAIHVHAYGSSSVTVSGDIHQGDRVLARGVHTVSPGQAVQPVELVDTEQP